MVVNVLSKTQYPSFVMILLDDIGWGDPSYNNGTTYTPYLDAWTKEANTITFHRGYAGVCNIYYSHQFFFLFMIQYDLNRHQYAVCNIRYSYHSQTHS